MRMNKEERAVYESYQEALRTKASLIKGNYRYGEIAGIEKGLQEALQRLLESGMDEAEARRVLKL